MIRILFTALLLYGYLSYATPVDIDNTVKELESLSGCELVITSGFRTPEHNKRVGGAPNSYHLYNRARDVVPKDKKCISIKELGKIACKITSSIIYKKHIHLDNRKNPICIKGRYK